MTNTRRRFQLVGALLTALATSARGQVPTGPARHDALTRRVAGVVLDSAAAPVAFADVRLTAANGFERSARADGTGYFMFLAVPIGPAQLEVRRLGFRPVIKPLILSAASQSDSTRIILLALATELATIDVEDAAERDPALLGFYARRSSNNFGHYLDRSAIEASHVQRVSDALRSVPGIVIQPSSRIGNIVRIRNCRPTIWVDGVRVPDAELDEVASVDDVAAVEIYKSLAGLPQQFVDRTNPCGAILLWSRNR